MTCCLTYVTKAIYESVSKVSEEREREWNEKTGEELVRMDRNNGC